MHNAVPFKPFSLVLADGRAFHVPHPDFLSVSPKGTVVSLWAEDGHIGGYWDTALVAEIRMDGNGAKSARRRKR